MLIQLLIFIAIPIATLLLFANTETNLGTDLYLIGIAILGSSIYSVERATPIKQACTLTSLLYTSSVALVIWGFFTVEWYWVLLAVWVLSYYLYFIRRIIWLRLYVNGKTGLELLNWDNIYIPIGIILATWGLLTASNITES